MPASRRRSVRPPAGTVPGAARAVRLHCGSSTVKVAPCSGAALARTRPPWSSTRSLTIASPTATPFMARPRDRPPDGSARRRSEMRFGRDAGYPLSLTRIRA